MFYAIIGIIFFASVAMTVTEGLWSNSLTLINVVISGVIAFGFYSPLTIMADELLKGEYTYLLDFLVLWAVFAVSMILLKALTDGLSKTRLRLKHPIDAIAGPAMGVLVACAMVSFVVATLHTSPQPKDFLGGGINHPKSDVSSSSMFSYSAPDLAWLSFYETISGSDQLGSSSSRFKATSFSELYKDRREKFENLPDMRAKRG